MMNQPVIVDAVRTPMGRSRNGVFRNVRAEELSASLMRELLKRSPDRADALCLTFAPGGFFDGADLT